MDWRTLGSRETALVIALGIGVLFGGADVIDALLAGEDVWTAVGEAGSDLLTGLATGLAVRFGVYSPASVAALEARQDGQ